MDVLTDPLGKPYWSLNRNQRILGAALRDDWIPLRDLLEQAAREGGTQNARMKWEKLCVLGYMDVESAKEGQVMVRRGQRWRIFHERELLTATSEGLCSLEIGQRLSELFADIKPDPGQTLKTKILVEKIKLAKGRRNIERLTRRLS